MSILRVPERLLRGRCHQRSTPMRFVCLVYFEPETFAALSPSEKATIGRDSMAYDKELGRSGHYIVAEALEPVQKARTTRVRSEERRVGKECISRWSPYNKKKN